MAYLLTGTTFRGYTDAGAPLVGGRLHTYASGTTTMQPVYTDSSLSVPHTNPVILDARGEKQIWLDPSLVYTFHLTTPLGATVGNDVDGVQSPGAEVLVSLASTAVGKGTALVGSNDAGGYWTGTTAEGQLQEAGSLRAGMVSVLYHGADGTGATDCSAAVQAAVDALSAGGTLLFPPGKTFRFDLSAVGYKVLIDKSLHVIATGATFDIHATVKPATWAQEQHNAIFRLLQVDGFTWTGGTVDGNRDDATTPWVGFIVGHGCKNVHVTRIHFENLDHNEGSVRFDCLLPDYTTLALQENIELSYLSHRRCYYGPYVVGSINGLNIHHNWFVDGDIQNPQSGYARGYSAAPTQAHYCASIGVYGFDSSRASTAGYQQGVKITDNYANTCTQGPVAYNSLSSGYTSSTEYECRDIIMSRNTLHNCLTGLHINGWDQCEANDNIVTRLATASFAGYTAVVRIATTAGMSGAAIEIATAGRNLSACNNNIKSSWPMDTAATDLTGSMTGILFGIATNSFTAGERLTTALVDGNIVEGFYIGIFGVGTRAAQVTNNRISKCRRFFENNTSPQIGGQWPEGVFSGNTIRLDSYAGTSRLGGTFKGRWDFIDNKLYGDGTGTALSYAVTFTPGCDTISIKGNKFTNTTSGVLLTLPATTGAMTAGSPNLTLASAFTFSDGQTISVAGAGTAGATLTSTIVSGGGTVNLVLAANAATTVAAALVGGPTVNVDSNEFNGIAAPIEIVKDVLSTVRITNNRFTGSTTVNTFSGAGTHGTYYAQNNTVQTGGWSNDAAAVIPSDVGTRSAAPGSGTWNVGCRVYQSAPTAGGFIGWVYTAAGWKTFGTVTP